MSPRTLAFLLLPLSASCGSAPRPAPATAPGRVETMSIRARTTVLAGPALELGALDDGAQHALAGGHRIRWTDRARVEVAEEAVAAGLAGAVFHADGWRFADRHGELWSASSFLGPLTHAGSLGIRHFEIAPARGVIAVLAKNRTRALLLSDGRTPARQACPFPVLAAAFADARHGLVVADGGGLFRTEDAGETWLAVAVAEGPFAWVDLDADGWLAIARSPDGTTRVSRISRAGVSSPIESGATSADARPGIEEQRSRAALFALATADGFLSLPVTAVIDGVALMSMGAEVMRVDLARSAVDSLHTLPRNCRVAAWGARFLAICADDVRVGDGRAFRRLPGVPGHTIGQLMVASEDGRSLAWIEPMPDGADQMRLVVVNPEARARHERLITAEQLDLRSVHGTTVLLGPRGSNLRLLDVESGRDVELAVEGTVHGARISAGGDVLVSAIARRGDALVAVLQRGRFDGRSLEVVSTPRGAIVAGLVDARHGVAAGETLDQLVTTSDGGASWQPVQLSTPAEAALIRLAIAESDHPFFCDASRCVVAPSRERPGATVVFGGPPIRGPRVLRAASGDVPIEAITAEVDARSNLGCEIEQVADERSRPLASGAFATATATGVLVSRPRATTVHVELSWSGTDSAGTYRARARGTLPAELASRTETSRVRASWVSRVAALVDVCRGDRCVPMLGRAGGTADVWTFPMMPSAVRADGTMLGVVATGSTNGASEPAIEVGSVGEGAMQTLRRLVLPDAADVGLAASGDASVVARTPSGRWRSYPLDASRPPRVYPNVSEELSVCATPTPTDALVARFRGGPSLDGRAAAATTVELTPNAACVRSIEIDPADDEPVSFRGLLVASAGGLLEGQLFRREGAVGDSSIVREGRARRFRCRLAD